MTSLSKHDPWTSSSASTPAVMSVDPIHLAPLHPDDRALKSLPHQDSFLSTFPADKTSSSEPSRASSNRRRCINIDWKWSWDRAATVLWAVVPLVFYVVATVLLLSVLLSTRPEMAFMVVKEKSGTGRLEYFILNSCSISPGTTERICTGRSLYADFVPSLVRISSALPGFSPLKLPFYSFQTPSIFLASLSLVATSFFLYLPLWTLVYFPHTRLLPRRVVQWIRFRSSRLFYIVGVVSFLGFIFVLSIGLGYMLYFMGYIQDFAQWYQFGLYRMGQKEVLWVAEIGPGFGAVWAATVCSGMTVVSINISLHNGLDERVEWPKDSKDTVNTFGAF